MRARLMSLGFARWFRGLFWSVWVLWDGLDMCLGFVGVLGFGVVGVEDFCILLGALWDGFCLEGLGWYGVRGV